MVFGVGVIFYALQFRTVRLGHAMIDMTTMANALTRHAENSVKACIVIFSVADVGDEMVLSFFLGDAVASSSFEAINLGGSSWLEKDGEEDQSGQEICDSWWPV